MGGVDRKTVAVALAAVLVVMAGCTGGGGGDGGGADSGDSTPTATTAPGGTSTDTTTASTGTAGTGTTATATGTNGETTATSSTPEGGGDLEFEDYRSRVRDQGSYAVTWEYRVVDPDGQSLNQTGTTKVDFESGEQYQVWTIEDGGGAGGGGGQSALTYEIYRPPGGETNYICIRQDDRCIQQMTSTPTGDQSQFVLRNFTTPFAQLRIERTEDFEDRGLVTIDQGQRRKYVATDDTMGLPSDQYEDLRMEVYVDPDSRLVTRVTYTVTVDGSEGEATTVRWSYSYRFGVDVSPPDWYEE